MENRFPASSPYGSRLRPPGIGYSLVRMSSCVNDHRKTIECAADMDDETASKPEKDHEDRNDDHEDDEGEEEDEEEEDLDFNPFMKKTRSPEASSSLSSEGEGVDCNSSKITDEEVQNYAVGDANNGEEVVVRTAVLDAPKRRKRNPELGILWHNESANRSSKQPGVNVDGDDDDDEDAICMRTRARYSLAGFTLDELETFLQETDDEDDLQNVNDEEEYRKFLSAVLQGGDADGESRRENENVDDEDEDNDADFEIELEELLESEVDETAKNGDQRMENERRGRRPQTRQNRRHKASAQYKKKLLEQTNRPLRPLVPILPNGVVAPFTTSSNYGCFLSSEEGGLINGFSSEQIGQLHYLIHEHVQLLIQIFSICVFDASRQHIASQVQGLIFEMLHRRKEVIARKSLPYPSACFHPAHISPSGACKLPIQRTVESRSPSDMQLSESQNVTSEGRTGNGDGQLSSLQSSACFWVPSVSGSIVSVLDVAPLKLVGRFMDDVSNAVREHRQNKINSNVDAWNERKPLFHLPCSLSFDEGNGEVRRGNIGIAANARSSTPVQDTPKKTLAASIVESAKKQSITLVPKDVNKLAERFIPFFNPELFPHKPPPAAVANRILFTDSEDELLALGMMEYNTDWKAIKQRFLPCKSEHQIFVRQKNRCSSKAPENPIKVVRKMKTSPLTAEEIESIQEGLRAHKLDWMSMWRVCVPHRDPSLLPRQLRIALGTQRSYKVDAAKKEKRRIYERKRRSKTSDSEKWQPISEKADGMCGQNYSGADPVYHKLHWRSDSSLIVSSNDGGKELSRDTLSKENINNGEPNDCGTGESQSWTENKNGVSSTSLYNQQLSAASHTTHLIPSSSNTMRPNYQVSNVRMNTRKSQIHLPPYRTRRTDGACLVKLAPELPPVNLPRSVRVIPVSDFKSSQLVGPMVSASRSEAGNTGKEFAVPKIPHIAIVRTTKVNRNNQVIDAVVHSRKEDSANVKDTGIVEERGSDSDLQLHPLLFQAPEDGQHPYYPLNSGTGPSSSLSFFSGNQLPLHLSLFHNPQKANHVNDRFKKSSKTKETDSSSSGIDFHPLLQKTQETNSDMQHPAYSNISRSVNSGGNSSQLQNHIDPVQVKSPVNDATCSTGTKEHPNERANELDLEIHLSSTSTKEINWESRDGANSQPWLAASAQKSAVPSNNFSRCNIDDAIDRTHPEIVMEQEELSDSEEESEEHVEFECEEMTDSDGEEGAGSDQVTVVHVKEGRNFEVEEVPGDADYGDVQCEQRRALREEENSSIPRISSHSLKLSLTSIENDDSSRSWLSLDSCAPAQKTSLMGKQNEDAILKGPAAKSLVSCRPDRSCKKTTSNPKRIGTQKEAIDMAHELSLGPFAVSTSRKSRKSCNRTNTSFSSEMT